MDFQLSSSALTKIKFMIVSWVEERVQRCEQRGSWFELSDKRNECRNECPDGCERCEEQAGERDTANENGEAVGH